jgi:hypothetical protein
MVDILSLIGIPTTTFGAVWMLVRIGIWYWYNHTVNGKTTVRDVRLGDYSVETLLMVPSAVFIVGIVLLIAGR